MVWANFCLVAERLESAMVTKNPTGVVDDDTAGNQARHLTKAKQLKCNMLTPLINGQGPCRSTKCEESRCDARSGPWASQRAQPALDSGTAGWADRNLATALVSLHTSSSSSSTHATATHYMPLSRDDLARLRTAVARPLLVHQLHASCASHGATASHGTVHTSLNTHSCTTSTHQQTSHTIAFQ